MNTKVLSPDNLEEILDFERKRLDDLEEMERSMLEWRASWRKESLEHYLAQGWSYAVFEEEKLSAYFLAQPILFLAGHMQSLWLEHLSATNEEQKEFMLEVAYRTSREKHLQKLLFNEQVVIQNNLQNHKWVQKKDDFYSTNTTKMND